MGAILGEEGRIPKKDFIGSASTFLAICILATLIRFYIRIHHQRSFGWDDSLLLLGLVCLITGMALLYIVMDHMYDAEALVYGDASTFSFASADLGLMLERMLKYRQYSAAALSLMWFTICCVKFSFLALFKKLVRQKVTLERYWWFVLAFNVMTAAYGTTVYFLSCPYFTEDKVFELLQCVQGEGLKKAMKHPFAQMAVDLLSDIFILAIPIILIWQIRVHWTQKLALAFSLCLTLIMVIITAMRIVGLRWRGKLDSVWETYFIVVAAEVGMVLVAVSAFRAFYISKTRSRREQSSTAQSHSKWYGRSKEALVKAVSGFTGKETSYASGSQGSTRNFGTDIRVTMDVTQTVTDSNGMVTRPPYEEKDQWIRNPGNMV